MKGKIKDVAVNSLFKIDITDAKIEKQEGKRALIVDLEFSASGKVTNGRIYPPAGHRAGLDTWTRPFAKPALVHHEESRDAIGRVASVQWVDTEKEALAYLGGDVSALADIKRAFQAGDGEKLYAVMKKHGALDKKWPGLGKLLGKVRIVDEDAIQKFIDERYLTWSAGQGTDALICMNCGSDWFAGDQCDHRMGGTDADGNPVIFLCGTMSGREISVVNSPANDTSVTLSMAFEDSASDDYQVMMNVQDALEDTQVFKANVQYESETQMNIQDITALEFKTVLEVLSDEAKLKEFQDALAGNSVFEIQWLIRVHDWLHSQYDFELKYRETDDLSLPLAVFKLHGMIHDMSDEKDFRDSMINGHLDHFGPDGAKDDSYLLALPEMDDKSATLMQDIEEIKGFISKLKMPEVKDESQETQEEARQENVEGQVLDKEDIVVDETIDWALMDLALQASVPTEARMSDAQRAALKASAFCGKGRTVPVADSVYADAVRALVQQAKLSDEQKTAILACVDRKVKNFADASTPVHDCKCKDLSKVTADFDSLKADYTAALQKIEATEARLSDVLKVLRGKLETTADIQEQKLDVLSDWFDNMDIENLQVKLAEKAPAQDSERKLKPTESPNGRTVDHTATETKLTNFQKTLIQQYKGIVTADGKEIADEWFKRIAPYLPSDFEIEKHIEDKE